MALAPYGWSKTLFHISVADGLRAAARTLNAGGSQFES
jgi:hypothetical protein